MLALRQKAEEITSQLTAEIAARVAPAGVRVLESRFTRLPFAPEIAQAMLRRQQAEAVVAARQRIVEGAVGMVELDLARLEEKEIVELDTERKASMVSNLIVVLCSEQNTNRPSTPDRCTSKETTGAELVAERKSLLLRLDPLVHDALVRWADDELRSSNAQIEFILRGALATAGRMPRGAGQIPRRGRPAGSPPTAGAPRT